MKNPRISIVVIAHNEEVRLKKCIESLLHQTISPYEIIVVAHNCTDNTYNIAKSFISSMDSIILSLQIKVIEFNGLYGAPYARIKGVEATTGDIILCIDGDSYAAENWIAEMLSKLGSNHLVGSHVKFKGPQPLCFFLNFYNRIASYAIGEKAIRFLWGASFGFSSQYREYVIHCIKLSIKNKTDMQLLHFFEDYTIASFFYKKGLQIEVTNKTRVTTYVPNPNMLSLYRRIRENVREAQKISMFFQTYDIGDDD